MESTEGVAVVTVIAGAVTAVVSMVTAFVTARKEMKEVRRLDTSVTKLVNSLDRRFAAAQDEMAEVLRIMRMLVDRLVPKSGTE